MQRTIIQNCKFACIGTLNMDIVHGHIRAIGSRGGIDQIDSNGIVRIALDGKLLRKAVPVHSRSCAISQQLRGVLNVVRVEQIEIRTPIHAAVARTRRARMEAEMKGLLGCYASRGNSVWNRTVERVVRIKVENIIAIENKVGITNVFHDYIFTYRIADGHGSKILIARDDNRSNFTPLERDG